MPVGGRPPLDLPLNSSIGMLSCSGRGDGVAAVTLTPHPLPCQSVGITASLPGCLAGQEAARFLPDAARPPGRPHPPLRVGLSPRRGGRQAAMVSMTGAGPGRAGTTRTMATSRPAARERKASAAPAAGPK